MENRKKILIVGNGFDLAHGLPTKYTNFLAFCKGALNHFEKKDNESNKEFIEILEKASLFNNSDNKICYTDEVDFYCEKIHSNMHDNIWAKYLNDLLVYNLSGDNWIDFESEISHVIQFLDSGENHLNDEVERHFYNHHKTLEGILSLKENKIEMFLEIVDKLEIDKLTFNTLRKILFEDLQKLITALELYLAVFVEKIKIGELNTKLEHIAPDMLLSFNYTHTYNSLFKSLNPEVVFHIHGECNIESDINNMVLGIDEYHVDERKNTKTDYSIFKKFVQRVQKHTYIELKKILLLVEKHDCGETIIINKERVAKKSIELYFFGHSLDVTDKDVLIRLFELPAIKITVFCKDSPTEGEYIANIIKLIGQDDLVMRIENNLLEFVLLYDK